MSSDRNVDAARIEGEIKRVGVEKFSEVFLEQISKVDYIFNPEEFFSSEPKFMEVYNKHLNAFHLGVYREFLPLMDISIFARTFGVLGEEDIPKKAIYEALEKNPNSNN